MTNPEMTERGRIDQWLASNCGRGVPHGAATDQASALHGLAYVLNQIEATNSYHPFIGQTNAAASAIRWALDRFAVIALAAPSPGLIGRLRDAQAVFDEDGADFVAVEDAIVTIAALQESASVEG